MIIFPNWNYNHEFNLNFVEGVYSEKKAESHALDL